MNRPELASQRAAVQATLDLLRQEKIRPLLPSVVLQGSGPDGDFTGGVFGGGRGGDLSTSSGRADVNLGLVWSIQNLGLGNRAQVRGRAADKKRPWSSYSNSRTAWPRKWFKPAPMVEGAQEEIPQAETAVREATITFAGTLKGLTQIRGAGNLLQPVSRPQEGVAALQQLNQAYQRYFIATNSVQPGGVSTLSRPRLSFADPGQRPAAGRGSGDEREPLARRSPIGPKRLSLAGCQPPRIKEAIRKGMKKRCRVWSSAALTHHFPAICGGSRMRSTTPYDFSDSLSLVFVASRRSGGTENRTLEQLPQYAKRTSSPELHSSGRRNRGRGSACPAPTRGISSK